MTRDEAFDKAAECLASAEGSVSDTHFEKKITLAQIYIALAREMVH